MKTLRVKISSVTDNDACNTLTKCPFYPNRCKTCKPDRLMLLIKQAIREQANKIDLADMMEDV